MAKSPLFSKTDADGDAALAREAIALSERLPKLAKSAEFLRTVSPPTPEILRAAHELGLNWIAGPVLACGRIELTRWLREQSVSETRHRYGQIPDAAHARR